MSTALVFILEAVNEQQSRVQSLEDSQTTDLNAWWYPESYSCNYKEPVDVSVQVPPSGLRFTLWRILAACTIDRIVILALVIYTFLGRRRTDLGHRRQPYEASSSDVSPTLSHPQGTGEPLARRRGVSAELRAALTDQLAGARGGRIALHPSFAANKHRASGRPVQAKQLLLQQPHLLPLQQSEWGDGTRQKLKIKNRSSTDEDYEETASQSEASDVDSVHSTLSASHGSFADTFGSGRWLNPPPPVVVGSSDGVQQSSFHSAASSPPVHSHRNNKVHRCSSAARIHKMPRRSGP